MTQYQPENLTDDQLREDWGVITRSIKAHLTSQSVKITPETFGINPHVKVLHSVGRDIYRESRKRGMKCECPLAIIYATEPEFMGDDPISLVGDETSPRFGEAPSEDADGDVEGFIPMKKPERAFTSVREFAVYAREEEEFFPVLGRTMFDGRRAQVHRHGDIVTIYDESGMDITSQYKDLLSEFVVNSWPHDIIMNGTILGWSGEDGYLSGDFVSLPEHARAKSFSFVANVVLKAAGVDYTESVMWGVWGLYTWFPANGGHRFTMPPFAGAGWIYDLGYVIQCLNIGPGFKGIEFENIDNGRVIALTDSKVEFGLNRDMDLKSAKFDFSFNVEAMTPFGHFSAKVTPHFAASGDENPDFVVIESPAFPHGKLIDGTGQQFDYPKEEVARAKLTGQPRGRAIPFVNWSHIDDQQMLAGQILKIWWDPEQEFKFDDHTGRHIEGVGMLMQKSILTNELAIWNAMRGNITAISIEPMFDANMDEGRDWPVAFNIAVTGLGLTNHPAIGNAMITKVCVEDGTCMKMDEQSTDSVESA